MPKPKSDRVSKTFSLPKALADRLEAESEERWLGQSLLVEKALDAFLDHLPAVKGPGSWGTGESTPATSGFIQATPGDHALINDPATS